MHRLKEPESFEDRLETHLLVSVRGKQGSNFYILREGVLSDDIKAIMVKKGYNRKTYQMALGLECSEAQRQVTKVDVKENAVKTVESVLSSDNSTEIVETVNTQSNPSLNTNTLEDVEPNKLTELISVLIKQQTEQNAQFTKLEQQFQALLLQNKSV